jgi:hypothetical protein
MLSVLRHALAQGPLQGALLCCNHTEADRILVEEVQ